MSKFLKTLLVVILVLVCIAIGYYGYRFFKEKKLENEVKTEVANVKNDIETKYYDYMAKLKDSDDVSKYGIGNDVSDVNVTFIQPENIDEPVLIAQYEKNDINYMTVYYEDKNNNDKVKFIQLNVPSQLIYMYNEKTNSYNYYVEEINPQTRTVSFESITNLIENNGSNANDDTTSEEVVYKSATTKAQLAQNIVQHLSNTDNETYKFMVEDVPDDIYDLSRNISNDFYKFDEVFIVPNVEKIDYTKLKFEDDAETFKKDFETAFDNLKTKADLVTDEVKQDTENKITIVKNKVAEIENGVEEDLEK